MAYDRLEADHSDLLNKYHELERETGQLRTELRHSKASDVQAGAKRKRRTKSTAKQSTDCKRTFSHAEIRAAPGADRRSADTPGDLETSEEFGGRELSRKFLAQYSPSIQRPPSLRGISLPFVEFFP